MRLNDYINTHDLTRALLAEKLGVSHETVRRYLTGESVPRPRTMQKITDLTEGQVTPNDFYTSQSGEA